MSTTKLVAALVVAAAIAAATFEWSAARTARSELAISQQERTALAHKTLESDEKLARLGKELADLRASHDALLAAPKNVSPTLSKDQAAAREKPVMFTVTAATGVMAKAGLPPVDLNNAEIRAAVIADRAAKARAQFARFFATTHLDTALQDKLIAILVEQDQGLIDLAATLQPLPLTPDAPQTSGNVMQRIFADAGNKLRALLGESGWQQYQQYSGTLPDRANAEQLAARLTSTEAPLAVEQIDQLTQIFSENRFRIPRTSAPVVSLGGASITARDISSAQLLATLQNTPPTPPVTDAAIEKAAGLLSAPQLGALRDLQAQQAAQIKMASALISLPIPPSANSAPKKPHEG